jgi:hypothetical protein
MANEDFFSSLSTLNRLKTDVRVLTRGLRLPDLVISSIEDADDRLSVITIKWRMDGAVEVLSDPTTSYPQMSEAFKTLSSCIKALYRHSIEWDDADLERSVQALEELAEEMGGKIFNAPQANL